MVKKLPRVKKKKGKNKFKKKIDLGQKMEKELGGRSCLITRGAFCTLTTVLTSPYHPQDHPLLHAPHRPASPPGHGEQHPQNQPRSQARTPAAKNPGPDHCSQLEDVYPFV